MNDEQAALLVKRLLGSYPSLSLHDPKVYIAELVTLLVRYPQWAGEKAIDIARTESPKFVPSVPEVGKACEAAIGTSRQSLTYAQEWDERSQRQFEERRAIEQEKRPSQEVIDRIRAEMAAAGMPILGDKLHSHGETPENVKAKYGLSDEAWNALPNAEEPGHWQKLCASHKPAEAAE